jgi:hypothetical protein
LTEGHGGDSPLDRRNSNRSATESLIMVLVYVLVLMNKEILRFLEIPLNIVLLR